MITDVLCQGRAAHDICFRLKECSENPRAVSRCIQLPEDVAFNSAVANPDCCSPVLLIWT